MNTAGRQGWVAGAKVLDAQRVEHVIETMQHRYVQCSQPGCTETSNYCRRELQLLTEASDDEESQSSASERGQEDLLDEDGSDQGIDLTEGEIAEGGPDQDRLDEL